MGVGRLVSFPLWWDRVRDGRRDERARASVLEVVGQSYVCDFSNLLGSRFLDS